MVRSQGGPWDRGCKRVRDVVGFAAAVEVVVGEEGGGVGVVRLAGEEVDQVAGKVFFIAAAADVAGGVSFVEQLGEELDGEGALLNRVQSSEFKVQG